MIGSIEMDEVVNFYLSAHELPDSQYGRIHSLGVRGYRKIYAHGTGQAISVELEVLANKTAVIPCDCMSKISVGVLNSVGNISNITEDSTLGLGNSESANRTSQPTQKLTVDHDSDIFYDPNGTNLGIFLTGQYGSGARSDLGFYRIDWDQRLILFNFDFPYTTVWLEYLPVYGNDGTYLVNPFFLEANLAFIEWNDPRRSPSERSNAKRLFHNEFRIGRRSVKPFDAAQAFLQYSRTTRMARF